MEYASPIKLFLPPGWSSITPEQKAAAYNGVGPEAFPAWLRNLFDFIFHWGLPAIDIHDVEYSYGRSRLGADLRLLGNLLLCAWPAPRRIILALLAVLGVLLFGSRAWVAGHAQVIDSPIPP